MPNKWPKKTEAQKKRIVELRKKRGGTKYVSKAEDPEGHAVRMERQRDRREHDRKHGEASRKGKDIAHAKKGAKGSYRAGNRSKNRAEGGRMSKPNTKKA